MIFGSVVGLGIVTLLHFFLKLFVWRVARELRGWIVLDVVIGVLPAIALMWLMIDRASPWGIVLVLAAGGLWFAREAASAMLFPRWAQRVQLKIARAEEQGITKSMSDPDLYHATDLLVGKH